MIRYVVVLRDCRTIGGDVETALGLCGLLEGWARRRTLHQRGEPLLDNSTVLMWCDSGSEAGRLQSGTVGGYIKDNANGGAS